ncbi:MFS transporter [Paenibacillus rhizoplanae]
MFTGGLLGQNMLYSFMSMYILFFYTDLLGIPATTASVILVVASIVDACLDPLMGMITDKNTLQMGQISALSAVCPVPYRAGDYRLLLGLRRISHPDTGDCHRILSALGNAVHGL